eukprot:bmy_08018T0
MFWFGILIICLFLSLSHSFPHRILFFKKQNLVVVTEQGRHQDNQKPYPESPFQASLSVCIDQTREHKSDPGRQPTHTWMQKETLFCILEGALRGQCKSLKQKSRRVPHPDQLPFFVGPFFGFGTKSSHSFGASSVLPSVPQWLMASVSWIPRSSDFWLIQRTVTGACLPSSPFRFICTIDTTDVSRWAHFTCCDSFSLTIFSVWGKSGACFLHPPEAMFLPTDVGNPVVKQVKTASCHPSDSCV